MHPIKLTAAKPAQTVAIAFDLNHQGLVFRTPNKTGQGAHKWSAWGVVTRPLPNGATREYRFAVYQLRNACNLQTVEIALYFNGRMLPESNLPSVQAAVLAAYVDQWGLASFDQEIASPAPAPAQPAKQVESIDCTPTWRGLLPALIAMIENGTPASRNYAIGELGRLADHMDSTIAKAKGA